MHVKKNLMLWVAVFALVLPLLLTGTASAKYIGDGAVPDGAGGLKAPADGICVISLKADGTIDIDATITTARDCQARLVDVTAVTPGDTLANVCTKPASNTAGVKYAAPGKDTCVTVDGNLFINGSISLVDLDRNAKMCNDKGGLLANAGATIVKNTADGTAAKCIAYGWQYRGQDAAGAPLAFGAEGTDASTGAGFCYATLRTGLTTTAECPSSSADPSVKYGYSMVGGANCVYSYGISGPLSASMTAVDGTVTTAGTSVDLSAKTTMGDCLAAGASWNNWVQKNGTAIVNGTATIATFDLTRQTGATTEGCLHCHSYTSQQNGPAERFKDGYLKTGHRNMLRKVVAGQPWSGPNATGVLEEYTAWGAGGVNSIDWNLATTTTGTYTLPLLYIFGDWMAPAPDGLDVVVMNGTAKYNNGSAYSCAACHTTGWSNNAVATAGLCNYSSKTTQAACEAVTSGDFGAGVWTPMTGVMGASYNPVQPGESFPAYKNGDNTVTGITGRWDLDGIQCSRCHEGDATGGTHHTKAVFGPAGGEAATKLCFGCHQSMAKTSNGIGTDADVANPTALIVKNTNTSGGYTPGFSGHVLGNSFLNSPHARFSGTVTPNALGKYDISTGTYDSTFKGYMCYQSSTSGSGAKTVLVGAEIHEIKDKATCESMYGLGAWRPDTRGGCTSCHDVHQSLFVEGQEGLRKECVSCHDNSTYATDVPGTAQASVINHPTGAGTPAGEDPADPCIVCHMPKPTAADFPMHVWRINSDAAYSTFPTASQFGIGATATQKNANAAVDSKGYANAVWVDLDLACGQCHNGAVPEAPVLSKVQLSESAKTMHGDATAVSAMTNAQCLTCHTTIVPGTNHHGVHATCTECHGTAANPLHTGNPANVPDKHSNAFCLTCHTNTGPYAVHHAVASVAAECVSCHTTPGVTVPLTVYTDTTTVNNACMACHSSAQGTKRALITSGAGDNHHKGSGTKMSTSSGVTTTDPLLADPAWSRSTAGCVYCHNLGKPFGDASTEVIQDQRDANSCSGACHNSSRPSSGTHHTGAGLALTSGTLCLTCHTQTGEAPGVTDPASYPKANWVDCTACHTAETIASMSHPVSAGTPSTTATPSTCVTCHDHPAVGVKPTVHTACDQCHGGGTVITALTGTLAPGVPYKTTTELVSLANNIHGLKPVARFTNLAGTSADYSMTFDASTSTGATSYSWAFGDGTTGSGVTTQHTYSSGATVTVILTVSSGTSTDRKVKSITPKYKGVSGVAVTAPVVTVTGNQVGITYTVSGGVGTKSATVNWGDGTVSKATGTLVGAASHNYANLVSGITGTLTVTDSGTAGGAYKTVVKRTFTVTVAPMTISGVITKTSTSLPLSGVTVKLMVGTVTKKLSSPTDVNGRYTFTNVTPGTYTLVPVKSGYVFNPVSQVVSAATASADFLSTP